MLLLTRLKTFLPISILMLSGSVTLSASILANATFTDTEPTPGNWQYDLTLNNTGTTTIGTFWFSWIPGAGFMTVSPTDIQSPAGWNDLLTNSNAAIQWTTTSNLLAPGDSISGFMFDSTLSPDQLVAPFAGPGLGVGDPTSTAFVYIAAPLADPGDQLTVTPAVATTPEPSAGLLASLGIAAVALLKLARRRTSR
jgi:hypothetical protein